MSAAEETPEKYTMRSRCSGCGCEFGVISEKGSQDIVRCADCDRYCYCAPRRETGKPGRSVSKRPGIKPKLRAKILIIRAAGKCEICGCSGSDQHPIEVGHMISVENAEKMNIPEHEYNSEENLCAMCAECNSGLGKDTVPVRLMVRVMLARLRFGGGAN